MDKPVTAVICGNRHQGEQYIRDHPEIPGPFIVTTVNHLRGMSPASAIHTGTWHELEERDEIEEELTRIGLSIRTFSGVNPYAEEPKGRV